MSPNSQDWLAEALEQHRSGHVAAASTVYRRVLAVEPSRADALHLLGVASQQSGNPHAAVIAIDRARRLDPPQPVFHLNLGVAQKAAALTGDAVASYLVALALNPAYEDAFSNLGNILREGGAPARAETALRRALAIRPLYLDAHFNLALALNELGRSDEAVRQYRATLSLMPAHVEAHNNLGSALLNQADIEGAVTHCRCAIAINPAYANAFTNLANCLRRQGDDDGAIKLFDRALKLRPNSVEALNNGGLALQDSGQLAAAIARYRLALVLHPEFAPAHNNLALTLLEQGRADDADVAFGRALAVVPDFAYVQMSRIFCQLYRPGTSLKDLWERSCRWGDRQIVPWAPPRCERSDEEKPRLGFVSADLRAHAVAFLILPALEQLHRLGWHLTFYSNSDQADKITARFQAIAAAWRVVTGTPDPALARMIEDDRIDILFDLAGFSGHNRLTCLAGRPAPVQIAWAGYPATTGLPAIDYILADAVQIPASAEPFFRERVIRMPVSYIAYRPPDDVPLPDRCGGPVTFGSFNALKKINPGVIRVWSRILRETPDSRLLMKTPVLNCPGTRQRFSDLFAANGVDPARLHFVGGTPMEQHLAWMGRADIALDPFPYSGGQTTLDCLWMGLPVITFPGETMASRHSLGYLSAISLEELAASGEEDYVARAVALVRDPPRLAALRAGMRQRILSSPLCDEKAFAVHLADALSAIWRRWLSSSPRSPSSNGAMAPSSGRHRPTEDL
jgi:protein O-GlcNAc transferase